MELEDLTEAYVPESIKTDQEQIDYNKLKRQVMKHDAQMAKIMFCIVMTGIGGLTLTVLHPEFNKSNGVVVWRDSSTVYVQDLKDTADYYAFAQDKKMLVDSKRAFPLIERGDTLKYVRPTTAPASFNHVRNVNSKTMADFAKERQRILDAAKSTNVLNQKTK